MRLLAEGRRTKVFLVRSRYGLSVLKVPKNERAKASLWRERIALRYLSSFGVQWVPKVYEFNENGLLEEYIPGVPFYKRVKGASDEEIRRVILESLAIAFEIDVLGVRHKELSLAHKHVFVYDRAYLIDFGHSAIGVHRRSLPQLAAYFFFRNDYLRLFNISKDELKEALKEYKRGYPKKFIRLIALGRGTRSPPQIFPLSTF